MNYFDILKYGEQEIIKMNLFLQQLTGIHILTSIEIKEYNEKKKIDEKYKELNKIKLLPIRDFALLDHFKPNI